MKREHDLGNILEYIVLTDEKREHKASTIAQKRAQNRKIQHFWARFGPFLTKVSTILGSNVGIWGYILIYERARVKKTTSKTDPGVSFCPISCSLFDFCAHFVLTLCSVSWYDFGHISVIMCRFVVVFMPAKGCVFSHNFSMQSGWY